MLKKTILIVTFVYAIAPRLVAQNCPDPTNLSADESCNSAILSWDSDTLAQNSTIQWGPAGFSPGFGTFVYNASSPHTLTGLTLNTDYEFWVIDSCFNGGISSWFGPIPFKTDSLPLSDFNASQNVFPDPDSIQFGFSALPSKFGDTFWWDYGDGSPNDTVAFTVHNYGQDGTYPVTLVVTNDCGVDTTIKSIIVQGISIEELNSKSFSVYPNPNTGKFWIENKEISKTVVYIEVLNTLGQVVMKHHRNLLQNERFEMNLTSLENGNYILKIRGENIYHSEHILLNSH